MEKINSGSITKPLDSDSAFENGGMSRVLADRIQVVQQLYMETSCPWIIGYSGGKDSTATLQLIWYALSQLEKSNLTQPIYIISTDTLVENPIVSMWVIQSHMRMKQAAENSKLPFAPITLKPELKNTFWVNLLGRGYPAPRNKFRWCTERLKIQPSNKFINSIAQNSGKAILVLGTRKAESAVRHANMVKHEIGRKRPFVSPNSSLESCEIFTPIEDWNNDDVWIFLNSRPNPWGHDNSELLGMYAGATEGGECPLVVDKNTESCGSSRFGCWVCTLVAQDKSMSAMVKNDQEKRWMAPLLAFRDKLRPVSPDGSFNDRVMRDYRKMDGRIQLHYQRYVPGPYLQKVRLQLLQELLEIQIAIQDYLPESIKDYEVIALEELHEIRRIWVEEKNEIEDYLPAIYQKVTGKPFPGNALVSNPIFNQEDFKTLNEVCESNYVHYEMCRNLLAIEAEYRVKMKRSGIFEELDKVITGHFFYSPEDAIEWQTARHSVRQRFQTANPSDKSLEQWDSQTPKALEDDNC